MPSKKKKYNSRFPPGRIKKIMQTDEEVGKVAQAVPVIISRALELFVESLLTKAVEITSARNAKTLTQSHMKQCILSESRFDFLKEFVRTVPDLVGDSDDLPAPSGSSVGGMGSSLDEPNYSDSTCEPVEAHQNGLQLKQERSDTDFQEAPLNLVTGATVLPVPPLHYFSPEDAAKSKAMSGCLVNSDTTSAVTNMDEDYDL